MGQIRLSSPHVKAVLDASASRQPSPDEDAVVDLLRSVSRLVPCDVIFWHWLAVHPSMRTYAFVQDPALAAFVPDEEPWLAHLPEHPIMSGSHDPVVSISDVLPDREFGRTWLYQEVFRVDGRRHEIGLSLPGVPTERNVIVLSRRRGDFTQDDHLALLLLRPHVAAALGAWRRPVTPLTRRQREVMELVARGLTDAQIARRLGVSESTVGKHLEQVYARTGVHSRVQAVRAVDGLLPGDGVMTTTRR